MRNASTSFRVYTRNGKYFHSTQGGAIQITGAVDQAAVLSRAAAVSVLHLCRALGLGAWLVGVSS